MNNQQTGEATVCSCYGCHLPVQGVGSTTGDPMCASHAAQDADSVRQMRRRIFERYRLATQALRARNERRRCRAEVHRRFDETQKLLECGFRAALKGLSNNDDDDEEEYNNAEEQRLAELLAYETEDAAAMAEGDLAAVHRLARRMDLALGQADGDKMEGQASASATASAASAVELAGQWTSLCSSFSESVRTFLKTTDCGGLALAESTNWDGLSGDVMWVAACHNTAGYAANKEGDAVVESVESPTGQPLSPLCLFASFHSDHQTDHLLALGSDGSRLQVRAQIDWNQRVRGLYCDSARQRLFVSQDSNGVTACSLAGRCLFRLSLPTPLCSSGLAGSPADNRLLVFDETNRRVLTVAMGDGQPIGGELTVGNSHTGSFGRLAVVNDNCALLTDFQGKRLLRIGLETGEAAEWPTAADCTERCSGSPVSVAVDAAGRVFVSYTNDHVIDIYSPDGVQLLGRLGEFGQPGRRRGATTGRVLLESPCGLAVWPGLEPGLTWLAVAERDARRVRLFLMA